MKFSKIKKLTACLAVASIFTGLVGYIPVNAETISDEDQITEDKTNDNTDDITEDNTGDITDGDTDDITNGNVDDNTNDDELYNYAKALQLSLYFYDANKCGEVEGNDRLTYRGNCHLEDKKIPLIPKDETTCKGTNLSQSFIDENIDVLDPDKDGCVDLSGGYHDAGDHVQFGLPQSYSASTLGWGYYEFKDAYQKTGQEEHMQEILRWFNDYFMRCTFRDDDGNVVAFAYQVGDGCSDHTYWGAPELQDTPRPAFFATSETPASDQCAGAAAALAVNYLNFKDSDEKYADKCLDTAKALYKFAQENRGLGFSGGFYNSDYDADELSWAAVWLNIATGESSYIDDITSVDSDGKYTGYMGKIIHSKEDTWQNIWIHSWDVVWAGVFAKLAPITNDKFHWYLFRWNCEYWSGCQHEESNDATYLKPTPGGFRVLSTWGSARYNSAAQLCTLVYNKYNKREEFAEWCKSQMNYILGDNPLHRCYEVGYSENSAKHPHHRASHGSLTNSMENPVESKHVLYGALVGGPGNNDEHKDLRTDYVYNEVAIDYNAGFVGALAGLYELYGENMKPDENFTPNVIDEKPFFITSKVEQENDQRTQVTIVMHNDTANPPRKETGLKARYFFNVSELKEKGQSIDDVRAEICYDEAKTKDGIGVQVNGPFPYDEDAGIYYVDLDWGEDNFHGTRELQVALISGMDSSYKFNWDGSNDYSRQNLTDEEAETDLISIYKDGTKVYGTEPTRGASIEITSPTKNEEIDYTNEENDPITLSCNAESNNDKIESVEYYADDEKIGETSEAPYSISYVPSKDGMDNPYTKDITLTAKAITESGKTIISKPVQVKVIFAVPLKPVAAITSPENKSILDVTAGDFEKDIVVESIDDTADIAKIEVFADGEKIGEADGNTCVAQYEALTDGSIKGAVNVNITANAILNDGSIIECDPIVLKVRYPSDSSLGLEIARTSTEPTANTVGINYTLTNNGNDPIDLSKVKIRYYFTSDSKGAECFYCDHANMIFNCSPWYINATDNVKGQFVKMDSEAENADSYLEISFKDPEYSLSAGARLECQTRFANKDWSNIDQSNDYSFTDDKHIVVMYDDSIILGEEAQ